MTLEGWHVNSPNLMLTAEDIADERTRDPDPPIPVRVLPGKRPD